MSKRLTKASTLIKIFWTWLQNIWSHFIRCSIGDTKTKSIQGFKTHAIDLFLRCSLHARAESLNPFSWMRILCWSKFDEVFFTFHEKSFARIFGSKVRINPFIRTLKKIPTHNTCSIPKVVTTFPILLLQLGIYIIDASLGLQANEFLISFPEILRKRTCHINEY